MWSILSVMQLQCSEVWIKLKASQTLCFKEKLKMFGTHSQKLLLWSWWTLLTLTETIGWWVVSSLDLFKKGEKHPNLMILSSHVQLCLKSRLLCVWYTSYRAGGLSHTFRAKNVATLPELFENASKFHHQWWWKYKLLRLFWSFPFLVNFCTREIGNNIKTDKTVIVFGNCVWGKWPQPPVISS